MMVFFFLNSRSIGCYVQRFRKGFPFFFFFFGARQKLRDSSYSLRSYLRFSLLPPAFEVLNLSASPKPLVFFLESMKSKADE